MTAQFIQLDDTKIDDETREAVQRLTSAIYAALMEQDGPVTLSVLQSVILTTLKDFTEPFAVWESLRKNIDEYLPKMLRATCAGES